MHEDASRQIAQQGNFVAIAPTLHMPSKSSDAATLAREATMPIHPDHPHWATASHDRWAWGRKYRMWNTAMDYGAYLYELGETEADARRSMQNSLDGWYRVDAEGQGSGVSGGSALRSSRLIGELVVYCEAADGFDYSFYLCRVPAGARPLHALDAFASQWKSQMMHHRQQLQSALGATVWPGR